ncbi:hypothetical protein HK096_000164, partial [Nowakowskiella sp. JEL0078]
MGRSIGTVIDQWQEWKCGLGGGPWKNWRKGLEQIGEEMKERKFFERRIVIIKEIKAMAEESSVKAAIQYFKNERIKCGGSLNKLRKQISKRKK